MTATAPSFPPLLTGRAVREDAFGTAIAMAREGVDGGTVVYVEAPDALEAAIVFAPEVPLSQAAQMLVVCGTGFANALGVLAPPRVALHLEWNGTIRVNGGRCGRLRMAASTSDPGAVPDWLVVGLDLRFVPPPLAPGETPDETGLYAEGCGDLDPPRLLESWTRHMLVWLNRWEEEGPKPLHAEWIGTLYGRGEETTQTLEGRAVSGTLLGTDDAFGLLLRTADGTKLIPLTELLERQTP
ncbi:DUF4444 domain-containing protein [Halovulum dunhuangense]|uniref:DUF4444 domain-containing protein n=1 Tax=Halovulum dunhuangense TaxID=1505036 RepID=A0A849L2A6_9RHOB|nr:biotin/lipoate--protein ligase family protein [Halovulum dunhuangense]NNU80374.1 DUF4444 domain-containing protein [Halovulum dunhuangense]